MLKSIGLPNRFTDIFVADDILVGTDIEPSISTPGQMALGNAGLALQASVYIARFATYDFVINTETYSGAPGGFVGTLNVASSRYNYTPQSRRISYAVGARETTLSSAVLITSDGSGGGSATSWTMTMPSAGVIRFTNTGDDDAYFNITFFGNKSLT